MIKTFRRNESKQNFKIIEISRTCFEVFEANPFDLSGLPAGSKGTS